jgi:hypothetical protein
VPAQGGLGRHGQGLARHAVLVAQAREEVLGQGEDVRAALPERRQRDGDDGQAVVEVLAKAPRADGGLQVFVGRGDHPHVDVLVAGGSEPTHTALLQHLEEFGLQPLREEADLIQEDRAAMRGLEETGLRAPGVGEGSSLEAEHLSFQQRVGDRRTVHVDERPVWTRPFPMDHPGQQALSCPGFTLDEDRRQPPAILLTGEQPRDGLPDRTDTRALADQVGQDSHARHLTLCFQRCRPVSVQDLTTPTTALTV